MPRPNGDSEPDPHRRDVVDVLLAAYRRGWFPMADPDTGELGWYDPDPRAVIPIAIDDPAGSFHVPRSLAKTLRRTLLIVTADTCFERVVRACAEPRPDEPTSWIDERIVAAYTALHAAGYAHSVEAWAPPPGGRGDGAHTLVGGIYGVAIGGLFAGESMFCKPDLGGTDASKVCLVRLVEHLRRQGYTLFDTQFANPHTERFGCVEIPRDDYRDRLARAVDARVGWGVFTPITPDR